MKTKTIALFVLLCVLLQFDSVFAGSRRKYAKNTIFDDAMDVSDFSVYYDTNTNATIRKMMPRPWYQPGWRLRLPFQGGKCTCDTFKCNCCSGVRVPKLNFDKETCAEVTFEPNEGLLGLRVQMDEETVLNTNYSATNPPPFCIPIPIPSAALSLMDFCIRLYDITVNWEQLHVCMDWDTRIDSTPVVILHFDCMNLGTDGVSITKPSSTHHAPSGNGDAADPPQLNADVYDPVTEVANVATDAPQ